MALPAFESMLPRGMAAAGGSPVLQATTATGAPLRMAFVYVPNGVNQANWWPKKEGKEFELNRTMQPLERLKGQVQVISGLDQQNAFGGKDGPGDHARACATFLTGVRAKKTAGSDIHAGVSVDQVVAREVGHMSRFPSLELACDAARKSGNCDSGYSCAYQFNLSWASPSLPMSPEANPRFAFERLFGAGPQGERTKSLRQRMEQQRSILDFVLDDTRALGDELGSRDRRKLDEYLTSVREIERRIQQAERFRELPDPAVDTPAGIPASFLEHVQLMYDLLFLAFRTDSTRIATFLLAYESSNRTFPDIGVTEGHHNLSHHQNKKETLEKIAKIDLWYMQQFARFLERLEEAKDIDGSLDAAQLDDRLRQRQRRRQPPQPQQPAVRPRRPRRRQPLAGPIPEAQGPAHEQHLPQHARPDGRLRPATPRRFHRADRGDLSSSFALLQMSSR